MSTIVRGSEDDRAAYGYSKQSQDYAGTWDDWLALPITERQEFEDGAACGNNSKTVIDEIEPTESKIVVI